MVAKVEWHQGELFPRVGFIVTNMSAKPEGVVHFYHGRGTAEQWIKEGNYALHWTRLSGKRFVCNQVRLGLFVLAYNLGISFAGWFCRGKSNTGHSAASSRNSSKSERRLLDIVDILRFKWQKLL